MTYSTDTMNATPEKGHRIPCLDGLRALSIALVLYSHARLTQGFPTAPWIQTPRGRLAGSAGVCLFFIISGYLITTLLLNEKQKYGAISLKDFYIRRSLRIFPAFYLFLIVAIILRHTGYAPFSNMSLFSSAAYWRNFFTAPPHDYILRHTWSLSIEEQFYLLWPLWVSRIPSRQASMLAITIVFAWPLLRLLKHGFLSASSGTVALDTVAGDTILYGCLLALWTREGVSLQRFQALRRGSMGLLISVITLFLIYATCEAWPARTTFLLPITRNIALVWLLWWCVRNSSTTVGKILDWRPIAFVGLISYSLYIWQEVFLYPEHTTWICRFPVNILAAVGAATLSFYCIERPLNAMRGRFSAAARHRDRAPVGKIP